MLFEMWIFFVSLLSHIANSAKVFRSKEENATDSIIHLTFINKQFYDWNRQKIFLLSIFSMLKIELLIMYLKLPQIVKVKPFYISTNAKTILPIKVSCTKFLVPFR